VETTPRDVLLGVAVDVLPKSLAAKTRVSLVFAIRRPRQMRKRVDLAFLASGRGDDDCERNCQASNDRQHPILRVKLTIDSSLFPAQQNLATGERLSPMLVT